MSALPDGGPAFPGGPGGDSMQGEDGRISHQYPGHPGMTLRDWFAGQALQGMIASESHPEGCGMMPEPRPRETWEARAAKRAYDWADVMIAAREAKE